MKIRKPLVRKTPLARASRLRSSGPIKAKRPVMSPEEKDARDFVTVRSGGWCEIGITGVCLGRGYDFSHIIARGRGGKWRASNGLFACRFCHLAITNTDGHRAEYEEFGWLAPAGTDTTEARVLIVRRTETSLYRVWVQLDDRGGAVPTRDQSGPVPREEASV